MQKSLTTFVGGGGPRFCDSVSPEAHQPNYAEVMIETTDKRDTSALVPLIQAEISRRIAGARVDVRQFETGPPIDTAKPDSRLQSCWHNMFQIHAAIAGEGTGDNVKF